MPDPAPTTGPPARPGLDKSYQPSAHESRITARWAASRAFHAHPARVQCGEAKPYCLLIPPPNVTGALHLGHGLNNTLQDILTRAHRMRGFETLWMPGTDHAGIATQSVVERRILKEEGKRRKDFTREEFIARVQAWKDEYEARITSQLKAMGCSCDFDRQRFTMDDICARAVREAFFTLFSDGLIYRGKRLVNWDPVLQTAVADDECYDEELDSFFYYLRYPLVHALHGNSPRGSDDAGRVQPVTWDELAARGYPGASDHRGDEPAWVTVATTRPETYLGDTGVALNPKDPRAKALRGLMVELPLVGRIIPIVEDDYVVLPAHLQSDPDAALSDPKAQFATGFLKVTPAHDPNDYEIGRRHRLAVINVMAPDASISDKHGWSNPDEVRGAHVFIGLSREDARKKVIAEFKARTVGDSPSHLFEGAKSYRHSVKHSERSQAIVEPYLSDQWFVNVTDDRLSGAANRALAPEQRTSASRDSARSATDGTMRFYPARYAKTFEQWHDNIRDWCISRQLWWGHRIPVWTLAQEERDQPQVSLSLVKELEGWEAEKRIKWQQPYLESRKGNTHQHSVCVRNESDTDIIAALEREGFVQDPDVLDTWFSSALWPLSTLGWPEPDQSPETAGLLDAFNPTSVLSTAREIITLWVSRMTMMNRYLLGAGKGQGPVPFKDVFIHAVVQDGEGRKMSKSLGNGVDPLDIIASHGADAMRFTLCQMTTQTQDVRMPVIRDPVTGANTSPKFDLGRNFCNKLWNAARFTLSIFERIGPMPVHAVTHADLAVVDKWMLSRLASSVAQADSCLKTCQFSEYADVMYKLLWWDFCDWYLEAIKPTVDRSPGQQAVLACALQTILRLLHPITPFVTEAIWEHVRELQTAAVAGVKLDRPRIEGLLCTAGWPEIAPHLADTAVEAQFESLRELINLIRNLRSEHQVLPKRKITLHAPSSVIERLNLAPGLVETMAGLERVMADAPAGDARAVALRFDGQELFASNLADMVDAGAERDRLSKQLEQLRKSEIALAGRLGNPGYADKAPAKLVEESKAQLAKMRDEISAISDKLKQLGKG
jgi:valyl-tRNA synthetase